MSSLINKDLDHIRNVKNLLSNKFNNLIFQIYCYGSRVTEHKQDSDFDIIIVTFGKIVKNIEEEMHFEIYRYGVENDIVFHSIFFSKEEFEWIYSDIPLIRNVRETGIHV